MPQLAPRHRTRLTTTLEHLALLLVALVPQLAARPGVVDADTKSYLYLDPGKFLRQSASMWDPSVGLGTVTHQQIGYLFPMGPFFWLTHAVGIPTWVAQRLWVTALLFGAGAGVLFLCRTLRVPGIGPPVAAFCYLASPYFLQYVGRISVILLPWAAIAWLIGLVERALRRGGWRHPALLALVVAAMSSVNASGALYVGIAPVLWLLYAGCTRLHPWRQVGAVVGRCAVLCTATSLWWIAGLAVEGSFGIDVLKYTETVPVVSSTSLSSEVARGLGYWYFYGGDEAGPWVATLGPLTQELWVLGLSFGVPLLAMAGAFVTRWRHRLFFVALVLVGMVLAVGAYPFASPSPVGRVLRDLFTHSVVGLAMRSTDRATPLVLLGIVMLVGAALGGLWHRSRLATVVLAGVALAVAGLADPALWNGTTVPPHFTEPSSPPMYATQAATALDRRGPSRVLAVPGENFAAYRYGDTVDPLWPALLTRPFVTREQQVMGSLAGADLLYGFDDPMQNGVMDPLTLAPIARLLGAGDILVQNDLAYERFNQPDPAVFWTAFLTTPAGLGPPVGFGSPRPNASRAKAIDEQTLALPAATPSPPPVAALAVAKPRPLVRAESARAALVVDGDGPGLVQSAGLGLLANDPAVLYAGTLDRDPAAMRQVMAGDAPFVVTDSNRRQPYRWNTIQAVAGATLGAGQPQPADPNDSPLDIFPGAPATAQSTARLIGVRAVTASSYGNTVAYLPENRPVAALDGNLDTSWETDVFGDPRGQWWQVTLDTPVTTDHVTLVQPQRGDDNQWITGVTLHFDGRRAVPVALGRASLQPGGQTINFPAQTFTTLRVTVAATNLSPSQAARPSASPIGLSEVAIPGVHAEERIVMPSDLLRRAGAASRSHRLTVVMTRQRVAPVPPRSDPEPALDRSFWLPTARTFTLTGSARIDTLIPDAAIDQLVGRPGSNGSGVVAYSLGRLPGDLRATSSAALDGDPTTMWSPGFGAAHQVGQWLSVHVPRTVTFDHLDLQIVADHRHSVPTALKIATDSGSVDVELPAIADGTSPGAITLVPVHFAALSGRQITVTVTGARLETTHDYYSGQQIALPLGIAELGVPGVSVPPPPEQIPSPCRSDLLQVDGRPVHVAITGSSADALAGKGLALRLCGPDANGLALGPGEHSLLSTLGHQSGVDVDQVVLDSAPGGGAATGDEPGSLSAPATSAAPHVTVRAAGTTTSEARVTGAHAPFWLVLGESLNSGWHATVTGGRDLGPPQLVDGFANGWLVTPSLLGGRSDAEVTLHWTPQSAVSIALVLSLAGGVLCVGLALWPLVLRFRRRHDPAEATPDMSAAAFDEQTTFVAPFAYVGEPPLLWVGAAGAVVGGAVTAAVAGPAWGLLAAAGVAVGVLLRWARLLAALSACGLVVAAATFVVVHQASGHFGANGEWPSHFGFANTLMWAAVLVLAADAVVETLRARRSDTSDTADTPVAPDSPVTARRRARHARRRRWSGRR